MSSPDSRNTPHATTILAVRQGQSTCIAGDGQVSLGETIMKRGARKVRTLYQDRILAGFAGASADAFTLFERFEQKLEEQKLEEQEPSTTAKD